MKATFIAATEPDWKALTNALLTPDGHENAGVLLCGTAEIDRERRLLLRRFVQVPRDQYVVRQPYHLEVSPSFYNRVVTDCLRDTLTPVIIHSHPSNGEAWYSGSDDYGETRLLGALSALLPGSSPASLVITRTAVTGRELNAQGFSPLAGLRLVGTSSGTVHFDDLGGAQRPISAVYDRQVRAFGKDGQRTLQALRVAIVGTGGIGSLVGEELARAGVQDFVLVDSDVVEESNVSRLFGATSQDVRRPKVDVVARHLKGLGVPAVQVINDSAIRQPVLMALRDREIVFCCVDNDRSRALLNRFAHQYLIPVIDHGTRLDARQGQISAAAGRVTVVGPGLACLRCSHHTNPERIRAESMPAAERVALQREGYVMGVDEPAPAVVSINTVVAGLGATAGINLFVRLTGGVQPVDQIYDARSGSVFPVSARHDSGCDVCDDEVGIKALGDRQIVSAYD